MEKKELRSSHYKDEIEALKKNLKNFKKGVDKSKKV